MIDFFWIKLSINRCVSSLNSISQIELSKKLRNFFEKRIYSYIKNKYDYSLKYLDMNYKLNKFSYLEQCKNDSKSIVNSLVASKPISNVNMKNNSYIIKYPKSYNQYSFSFPNSKIENDIIIERIYKKFKHPNNKFLEFRWNDNPFTISKSIPYSSFFNINYNVLFSKMSYSTIENNLENKIQLPIISISSIMNFTYKEIYQFLSEKFGTPEFLKYSPEGLFEDKACLRWNTSYGFKIYLSLNDGIRYELDEKILEKDRNETIGTNLKSLKKYGVLIGWCDGEEYLTVLKRIIKNFEENSDLLFEKPEIVKKLEVMLRMKAYRHRSSVMGFGVWRISKGDFSILYNSAEIALVQSSKDNFELCWKKEIFPHCSLKHIYFFAKKLSEEEFYEKNSLNGVPIILPPDLESWCPSEAI